MVEITEEEYYELIECKKVLGALEAGGVRNWEWYDASLENAEL